MIGRAGFSRAGALAALIGCLLVGVMALLAAGCGDTSSATGSSGTGTGTQTEASAQFFGKSAANQFSKFGEESSPAELKAAAAIIQTSLDARESHDWSGQCATLSTRAIKLIEKAPIAAGEKGCAKDLEAQGETAPETILKNNIKGSVVVFRVGKKKGYALYHGTDKKDWAMPMEKEGSQWKVASLVAEEIEYPPS